MDKNEFISRLTTLDRNLTEKNTDPTIKSVLKLAGTVGLDDEADSLMEDQELQDADAYCDEMDNCKIDATQAGEESSSRFYDDLITKIKDSGLEYITPYTDTVTSNAKMAVDEVIYGLINEAKKSQKNCTQKVQKD